MSWASGLELANNALAFAEHQNVELMAARGNQVVTGVGVTPQGTPDLTVAVASGTVLAGGVVVAVSASATFAGTPNTFSTSQGNLTSGQAQFVFIHVDSSGVITNTEGTAAAAGQQLPPDVPEDEVIIAMLTLTEGDTTIDSVDIEDWRINVPKGAYVAGLLKTTTLDLIGGGTGIKADIIRDEDDLVSDDPLALVTQQSIKAYIDTRLGIGSANKKWFPLSFMGSDQSSQDDYLIDTDGIESIKISSTSSWEFELGGTPFKMNTLNFFVTNMRFYLSDADGSNYVTLMQLYQINTAVGNSIILSTNNANSIATHACDGGTYPTFTATSMSGYGILRLHLALDIAGANNLKLTRAEIEGYYA